MTPMDPNSQYGYSRVDTISTVYVPGTGVTCARKCKELRNGNINDKMIITFPDRVLLLQGGQERYSVPRTWYKISQQIPRCSQHA